MNTQGDIIRIAAKRGKHKGGRGKKDKRKGSRSGLIARPNKRTAGVRSGVVVSLKRAGVRRVHRVVGRGYFAA